MPRAKLTYMKSIANWRDGTKNDPASTRQAVRELELLLVDCRRRMRQEVGDVVTARRFAEATRKIEAALELLKVSTRSQSLPSM